MQKKQEEPEPVTTLQVVEDRRIQRGSGFSLFDPNGWAAVKDQCTMLLRSGFFPAHLKTVEQVVAVAMIARDLGIPITTALQDIFIEERSRKPSTSTKLLIALVKRHPDYQWHSFEGSDETKGVFTIKVRGNPKPEVYTFTTEDAAAQELLQKFNWKKLKKIMLKWRAASMGIREQVPDIWLGYTHEELGAAIDVDPDGDIIVKATEAVVVEDQGAARASAEALTPQSGAPPVEPKAPASTGEPSPSSLPKYKPKWQGGKSTIVRDEAVDKEQLDFVLERIDKVLKDKCWKEVDLAAMQKALPKFNKDVDSARKFIDNLQKALWERKCACDLPF